MRREPRKKTTSIAGYVIFFITIAVTAVVAMYAYILADELSGGNRVVIAVTMLIIITVMSLLCTLVDVFRRKQMIDKPVREILEATEKIAAGDFSVQLQAKHVYEKYDDYDLIKENINIMAAELSKSEILKTDFISNVSHELKTPLAIIQSYASLLKDKSISTEDKEKHVKIILSATKRLSDLVTNILKLNKLENNNLVLEKQAVRIDKMIEDTLVEFEEVIEEKGLTLECDIEKAAVISSTGYLEIVWHNLISNAIKFTEPGGVIGVKVKGKVDGACVEISDTGCGISNEVGARIFDKFYQGDTSHSQEGNGLGLALVKKVIDLLGGEITVKSQVGKGSTFTINLKG